jgi:ankyrin repeat protein
MAKLLVGYGGNVNAYSSFYACTPLSRAAAYGHWPLVKFLVEKGAKINAADEAGKTPLHEAVRFLDVGMVTFLLEKGASANASDNRGFTPLSYIAEILKVSKKPWHQERLIKYLLIVRELISKGAKVSEATPDEVMAISDAFKDKPLITALMLEDGDTVKELSKHEENFDKLSELLIYAIAQGRRDIVSYLLEIGVNPREALKVVDTLLLKNHLTKDQRITYRSIQQQLALQLPLVEQIIRRTPLHDYLLKSVHKLPTELAIKINPTFVLLEALRRGEIDLVARALKAGADPNGVNKEGTSALALAALYPDVQKSLHLGSLLLDSKAIPTEELLRELCSLKDAQERSMIVQMILNTAFQGKSTLSPELKKMCKKMRFLY